MENLDKKEGAGACGDSCKGACGACPCAMGHMHGCHGGRHHLVKIILKLIIVIIIFWCGFKLGEITGSIRGQYGRTGSFQMIRGGGYSNVVPVNNGGATLPVPSK
jgi:hypothetical protein